MLGHVANEEVASKSHVFSPRPRFRAGVGSPLEQLVQHAPAWDAFYRAHAAKFFLDRHYLLREFECLRVASSGVLSPPIFLLDLGCGVGNATFPLLNDLPALHIVAVDASSTAVREVKARAATSELSVRSRLIAALTFDALPPAPVLAAALTTAASAAAATAAVKYTASFPCAACADAAPSSRAVLAPAHVYAMPLACACLRVGATASAAADASEAAIESAADAAATAELEPHTSALASRHAVGFDFVLLLFVMSAAPPPAHGALLRSAAACLRPGGRILLRDYALGDAAAARFPPSRRLGAAVFSRGDGTLAAFTSPARLRALAASAGLVVDSLVVVRRRVVNRGEGSAFDRAWLQAELVRPVDAAEEAAALRARRVL